MYRKFGYLLGKLFIWLGVGWIALYFIIASNPNLGESNSLLPFLFGGISFIIGILCFIYPYHSNQYMENTLYCPKCKKELLKGTEYCVRCGEKLSGGTRVRSKGQALGACVVGLREFKSHPPH